LIQNVNTFFLILLRYTLDMIHKHVILLVTVKKKTQEKLG
jgi:hypothetical protein